MDNVESKDISEFRYSMSEYDKLLIDSVKALGGFCNAHSHLDRNSTLSLRYLQIVGIDPVEGASLPLRTKQNLTGELHKGPAYAPEDLKRRMTENLEQQCSMLTRSVATMVDATPDLPEDGQLVINIANEIKEEMKDRVDLKVGIHPIFGFKKEERWELYREAAKKCDFLGGLPEKDEPQTDGRIGFKQHLKRILLLGQELKKPVHFHVDQANDPKETGTETLIEAVEWIGAPEIEGESSPTVWAIHIISPSAYSDKRFAKLVDGLLKNNIGVICCPSAAISMRQLRPIKSPTHNSIARVLEMLEAGVYMRIGTDNICDVFIPSSDGCILSEIKILSNAIRFYIINVLAKLAAGEKLNEMDKEMIRRSLAADQEFFRM